MTRSTARAFAWLVTLGCLAAVCVALTLRALVPTLHATQRRAEKETPVVLPWRFVGVQTGRVLVVRFDANVFTPRRWRIVPDDELTAIRLNGEPVSLARISKAKLRDFEDGFAIELPIRAGENELELTVDNGGGPGGIDLQPYPGWGLTLVGLGFVPWLWALARTFRLTRAQLAVLAVALLTSGLYWSATSWNERTYDAMFDVGHMGYVTHVATHWALPNPEAGWAFYHPPLYYVLGAFTWSLSTRFGLPGTWMMQALSLALWLVFLCASAGALKMAWGSRRRLWLATATVALWPSSALHSIRIGNDAALYAFGAVAVFFTVSWWLRRREGHLVLAGLFVGLALLSKSNAAVLAAALALLVVLRGVREGSWRLGPPFAAGALVLVGAVGGLGNGIYHYRRGLTSDWLVGNVSQLDDGMRVPVDVASFVPLDLPTFLTQPWIATRGEGTGRTNFWNFLLRSSLSGEFSHAGWALRGLALAQGVLLLVLVLAVVPRFVRAVGSRAARRDLQGAPWTVLGVLWIASLLALRIKAPFSCSNDFRYIVPILVPIAFALGTRGRWIAAVQTALAISSVWFSFVLAWS